MSGGVEGEIGSDIVLKIFFGCYGQWIVMERETICGDPLGGYCRDQIGNHTAWTRVVRHERSQQI